MATDQSATVRVPVPDGAARAVYHIKPHDTIDLSKLDLKNTRIDLLGADMVLTNTQTHSTVVLAQLALYLFSKEDAPTLIGLNGAHMSPETMLSHVGKVWEFTAQDFLGITSLEKVKDESESKGNPTLSDKVTAQTAAAPANPMVGMYTTPAEPKPLDNDHKKSDLTDLPVVATSGEFSIPPRVSTDTPDTPPIAPSNGLTFTFDARLLQPGAIQTSISATQGQISGGGAFETGVFDDRNSAQYSQEIIDVSAGTKSSYTIYSDNPTYFTDTTATRMMELTPFMPDGFVPSKIVISGLPSGFSIMGATNVAGDWVLTNPVLSSTGTILLPVVYPTGAATSFTVDINFTATFNASAGQAMPATGEISYNIERDVVVKTVNSAADGNYNDADGHLVWVLAENENSTKILTGDKTVTVYGGKGVDEVYSGAGNDTVYGGKGNDIISTGAGNDFLQGGDGNDTLVGGDGIDTADYSDKTVTVSIDLAALTGTTATAFVNGVAEDTLDGIENLNGGTGNDTLLGDAGANVLNGGDGNDLLMGRGGNDTINGGNGIDTVSYDYAGNGVTVTLSGGAATVNVAAGDVDTLTGIENITGSAYADVLTGDANANVLIGGAGADTFYYSGGADVIDGGADTDILMLTTATAGVTLNLGSVNGSGFATLTSGATTQMVKGIENITGSDFADILTGDAGNNVIRGGAGNDTINGGLGNDDIHGGIGSDTLIGGGGIDIVAFDDTNAAVTVVMTGAGAGTAVSGGDTDTFSGFTDIYLGSNNDSFTESTGADRVFGLAGNDTFNMVAGDSANDYIDGGLGINTVSYANSSTAINLNLNNSVATGNGTDTLLNIQNVVGTAFNDTIQGSAANNTLDGGGGINTLDYSYTATGIVGNFATVDGSGYATITIGTDTDLVKNFKIVNGGTGNDTFTGNGTGQTFNAGAGNDTFNASSGSDTFNGDVGNDTVNWSIITNAITATLDASGNATATFASSAKVDTLVGIENLTGGTGNDALTGNAVANILHGGSGNDTINGGDGNDTLYGDAGDDIIHGGNDDDLIYGGDGNDTLYGDAGNDTFYGDLGNDIIDGGAGTNTMDYSAITTAITVDMRSATGSATGTSIGTDSLTNITKVNTGSGADTFYGSSGVDTFNSGGGIDLVYGSDGNDSYTNFEQADYSAYSAKITANLATGVILKDTNNDGTTDYTDNAGTTLTTIYTGSYNDTVTGNTLANTISTGDGNDTIYASRGSDAINGGNGSDILNYVSLGGTINANLTLGVITKSIDSSTDSISGIEKIYAGSGADNFQITSGALANFTTVDGGTGTDTITVGSGVIATNIEAVNFANVFDNTEILDMRNATLNAGDTFNMTAADIMSLSGTSKTLDVYMKTGFSLALSAGSGYTIASDTTSGSTRTVTFSGTNALTLHVLSYA